MTHDRPSQAPKPLTHDSLNPLPHGFFTRLGGVSTGIYESLNTGRGSDDAPDAVVENRKRVCTHLGAHMLITPHQVHSAKAVYIKDQKDDMPAIEADALATDQPGIALGVLAADCAPVLLADPLAGVIGAAHAGWRGLASGVLLNTLNEFSDASQVSASLCPAIGFEAFEVGPEVKAAFPDAPEICFRNGEGDRWYADLFELARRQLIRAGIGSVHGGGICTFEDESGYFSYRRDGVTGRQVSLIWKASNLPRFQTG